MLDLNIIRKEIDKLENGNTNHDTIFKLNNLYEYLERHSAPAESVSMPSDIKERTTSKNLNYWATKERHRRNEVTEQACVNALKAHLDETAAELAEMVSVACCEDEIQAIKAFALKIQKFAK